MKTVCMRHEQAYEVGQCCPWCEPDPPGRAYSFPSKPAASAFFGVDWAVKGTFADGLAREVTSMREYDAFIAQTNAHMRKQMERLWQQAVAAMLKPGPTSPHDDRVDALTFGSAPRVIADPDCPPGFAYTYNPLDESYTYRLTVPVVKVHPSHLCKVKLP
jgi:hypothetical protein